jgi:hypothetical protein
VDSPCSSGRAWREPAPTQAMVAVATGMTSVATRPFGSRVMR